MWVNLLLGCHLPKRIFENVFSTSTRAQFDTNISGWLLRMILNLFWLDSVSWVMSMFLANFRPWVNSFLAFPLLLPQSSYAILTTILQPQLWQNDEKGKGGKYLKYLNRVIFCVSRKVDQTFMKSPRNHLSMKAFKKSHRFCKFFSFFLFLHLPWVSSYYCAIPHRKSKMNPFRLLLVHFKIASNVIGSRISSQTMRFLPQWLSFHFLVILSAKWRLMTCSWLVHVDHTQWSVWTVSTGLLTLGCISTKLVQSTFTSFHSIFASWPWDSSIYLEIPFPFKFV